MRTRIHVLLFTLASSLPVIAAHSIDPAARESSSPGSIVHGGVERTYRIYTPSGNGPFPVVFVLHGLRGDGKGMERYTQFTKLAAKENFIVVYPDGLDRKWNDRSYKAGSTDDVGFISALLDYIASTHTIDPARVYVTGASNGGMMANRLACDIGNRFAAIAPVIAGIPYLVQRQSRSASAMSILLINGTDDPLVPFGGSSTGRSRVSIVTALQTVDFWVAKNGCATTPTVTLLPDTDPSDGTRIERSIYTPGAPGAEVVFYAVQGGGHTWPGAPIQYLPAGLIGKTSQDIDATEVIWQFFKKHALPQ
ncbi:MAG: prolyl oligopeptidase family serine peptidase [Candidatus Hydrogenedentes bacterium]|nr:prolyl oligopeptidase family serine peptidase [Candidatus Hydrogenedentota bacterium]